MAYRYVQEFKGQRQHIAPEFIDKSGSRRPFAFAMCGRDCLGRGRWVAGELYDDGAAHPHNACRACAREVGRDRRAMLWREMLKWVEQFGRREGGADIILEWEHSRRKFRQLRSARRRVA